MPIGGIALFLLVLGPSAIKVLLELRGIRIQSRHRLDDTIDAVLAMFSQCPVSGLNINIGLRMNAPAGLECPMISNPQECIWVVLPSLVGDVVERFRVWGLTDHVPLQDFVAHLLWHGQRETQIRILEHLLLHALAIVFLSRGRIEPFLRPPRQYLRRFLLVAGQHRRKVVDALLIAGLLRLLQFLRDLLDPLQPDLLLHFGGHHPLQVVQDFMDRRGIAGLALEQGHYPVHWVVVSGCSAILASAQTDTKIID